MFSCPHCGEFTDFAVAGFPCACSGCLTVWQVPADTAEGSPWIDGTADLRDALRADPGAAPVLKSIYGSIRSLSVIPEIPRRVIALIHDPITGMQDVAAVILEDAVLTMGLLRMANSVAYGGHEPITDLKQACARLGVKGIANHMWSATNASFYRKGPNAFRTWLTRLWKHSAAAAESAEMISRALRFEQPHLAYIGALLHDAGKVVLLQAICSLPERAAQAFVQSRQSAAELLRKYHAPVGLHAVQYMKAPPESRSTTLFHHAPKMAADSQAIRLAEIVACANLMATDAGYDSSASDGAASGALDKRNALLTELGLDQETISGINEALPERIENVLSAFTVD